MQMNYRERLVELYREQISKTFKIRETATNYIVYKIEGDGDLIVAKLPKESNMSAHIAQHLVEHLSARMAEQVVEKLDKDMALKNGATVATKSSYTHADGRSNSQEHPLE